MAQAPTCLAGLFLDVLADLAAEIHELLGFETCRLEGSFHLSCVESSGRSKQLGFARLKAGGAAVLIDEHAPLST